MARELSRIVHGAPYLFGIDYLAFQQDSRQFLEFVAILAQQLLGPILESTDCFPTPGRHIPSPDRDLPPFGDSGILGRGYYRDRMAY